MNDRDNKVQNPWLQKCYSTDPENNKQCMQTFLPTPDLYFIHNI